MLQVGSADALIVVDVQNDFLPGGALAVPNGDDVIAPINTMMAGLPFGQIAASLDWHPEGHVSFVEQGGPWPIHCVAGTSGAAFSPALHEGSIGMVLRKGRSLAVDSYSAFEDNDHQTRTGLDSWLRGLGIHRVFVCGLALDFCVAATARDAARAGFESYIVTDAARGVVATTPGQLEILFAELAVDGVRTVASSALSG